MNRLCATTVSFAAALVTLPMVARGAEEPPANAQAAAAAEVLQVYDMRDLASLLPANASREDRPAVGTIAASPTNELQNQRAETKAQASSIDVLVEGLCAALSLSNQRLGEAVYLIRGERGQHSQLAELLTQLRAVYADSFGIEVTAVAMPASSAPAIGKPYAPGAGDRVLHRLATRVLQGARTRLDSTESTGFISDWTPVVGTQAMGYDPQTASSESGLSVSVTVTGHAPQAAPSLQLTACIAEFSYRESFQPLVGKGVEGSLTLDLPHQNRREIASAIDVALGKATVVGVVSGFKGDEIIVLVATVRGQEK